MLKYMYGDRAHSLRMRFLGPDNGGGEGSGGGEQDRKGQQAAIKTPLDDLDLTEFDDTTRATIEKAKSELVATLQRATKLDADLQHTTGLSRRFQGETDKLKQQLQAEADKNNPQKKVDPLFETVKTHFEQAGYKPEDIEKLAPTLTKILVDSGKQQREQLGRDLAPLATTVLAGEANIAFQEARSPINDPLGMLQDPNVAESVWKIVQTRIGQGQETSPSIVLNLAKMAWVDSMEQKAAKGESISFTPSSPPPPKGVTMNTPVFTFPGAGNGGLIPAVPRITDPDAAKNPLNDDTRTALAQTFDVIAKSSGGLTPKAFKPATGGRK